MLLKLCAATLLSAPLIEIKKMDNLPCYFVEDEQGNVITITFAFKTSGNIGQERKGVLYPLTLMLKEGAGEMNQRELKKYLLDHAIDTSFSSTNDHLFLTFRVAKDHLDKLFYCIRLLLENPRFTSEDLEKIKKIVISDLSQQAHMPHVKAQEAFEEFALKGHPYTEKISSLIENIEKLSTDDLKRAWSRSATKERMVVAVSGGVDIPVQEKIKKFLKELRLHSASVLEFKEPRKMNNLGKTHHVTEDIPQTVIVFALPFLDQKHPDFYALQFAIFAFASGYFETRLMTEIREKRGLAYGCGAAIKTDLLLKMMIGKTATNTKNVPEVIQIIKQELKKIVEKGLTQEEFEFHKSYLIGKAPLRLSDTHSINSQIIAAACCDIDPQEHINNSRTKYENLTLETINQAMQKHINPEDLIIVSVGREQ